VTKRPREPDATPGSGGTPPRRLTVASDGLRLAALLFLPAETPRGALLVCHGAGSRKENHALMGEQAAERGLAALLFDFRGHGASDGDMDAGGWHDVVAAGETLRRESGAPWLAGRGSSMGGLLLLLAARARPALCSSLVLLCPADPRSLLDGLDRLDQGLEPSSSDAPSEGRFDSASLRRFLETVDPVAAAHGLPRVLLAHARDDAAVPFAHSERLAAVLAPPTRFIALESGGHRAPARSPEVAAATIDWVLANS
jgi:pimeloyl-ACP methyl ester carboxylesterase